MPTVRRPRQPAVVAVIAGLVACGGLACQDAVDAPKQAESVRAPTAIDPEELARLRALGYAGVAEPLATDAEVGVLLHDPERASQGLNFFTNSHTCSAQIMDMEGELLHEWKYEPCFRWGNASLLRNGDIVVVGRLPHDRRDPEAAQRARYMLRMSFDGRVVFKKNIAAHHDVELTPDGHLATLTYSLVLDRDINPTIPVRDHQLLLTTQDGDIVRELSLLALMKASPAVHELQPVRMRKFDGANEFDVIHSNSVEFMRHPQLAEVSPLYAPTNALLCLRHQDSVIIVDTAKEEIVFSWGQGEISGPHDATLLPNGHILVFDNGLGRKWSRVVELDPLEREIVWEYSAPLPESFYTFTRGASQRLDNGNTLVTESDAGRVFEVTPEGDRVWEFVNFNMTEEREPIVIVRMRRYEGLTYAALREQASAGRLPMRD